MSITRRDVFVALVAAGACACVAVAAQPPRTILGSAALDWSSVSAKKTDVGEVRQFLRGPTATLDELELHVTTLNAGQSSHAPHRHPNEELVLLKEGTVEVLVDGEWRRVGPGSVVLNASNDLHGIRSVGPGPATYFVVNWTTSRTPRLSIGNP
jgi:XRE family transcriptional regulator, regulator of sulfur utilization